MDVPQTILRRYQEEVGEILALDPESFSTLVSALKETRLTVIPSTLALELAPKVQTISQRHLEEIVTLLLSLCSLRDQFDSSTREVSESASRAIREASDEDRERIKDRLVELLSLESLNIVAKSGSLQTNQERWMRRVQILTDMRPVFGSNPKDPPKAAVIMHMLKLSYFEDGEAKDFFVAMDTNDINDLYVQLERASLKAGSLKSLLAAAQVTYVEDEYKTGEGKDGTS